MTRARDIANFGDGIATADIGDGQITTAKIADGDVTSAKLFSGFANGITHLTHFRLTANYTPGGSGVVIPSANIEVVDDSWYSSIGTEVTHSSGIFAFPTTGLWQIISSASISSNADNFAGITTEVTQDNGSNFDRATEVYDGGKHDQLNPGGSNVTAFTFFNVTNTGTHKVRFVSDSFDAGSTLSGDTNQSETSFIFMRIGDSQ